MKNYNQQRLFEVMGRLDKTFKPKQNLNEWNFDKKKGEEEEKKETPEHEKSETPAEEKAEHEEGKKDDADKVDESKPKVPVNMIAKVGSK